MGTNVRQQGYFSVLRWRNDATRDEARNVAVVLVDVDGAFGGVKSAPLSTVSPRLHEQGLLDAMLVGLEQQFSAQTKPNLEFLQNMSESLRHSLCVTEPQPIAVPDVDVVLDALYRAYAAPRGAGARAMTKGLLLDRVVTTLRKRGLAVRRGEYVDDFLFDIVISESRGLPPLVEVFSFAAPKKDWTPAEHDAGHFLYALERVKMPGMAVIQPPLDTGHENALMAYERVVRWFDSAGVRAVDPAELAGSSKQAETQLPLEALAR